MDGDLCFLFFRRLFKVITIIVVFLLILCSTIINKGTLLLVTSHMTKDVTLRCTLYSINNAKSSSNVTSGSSSSPLHVCLRKPIVHNLHPVNFDESCLTLNDDSGRYTYNRTIEEPTCPAAAIRWVWGVVFIICTPFVFVFIRCLGLVCFKKKRTPTKDVVFVVSTYIWFL